MPKKLKSYFCCSSESMMANSLGFSSSAGQRGGEGRGVETEKDPHHGQMINMLANAVMKKLANSDPTKTLTADHMNHIKRCLSGVYPVFQMPDHPTYAVMIHRAVIELNEDGGSTEEALSKFIRERFDCLPLAHDRLLSHHLKKLCGSGEIISAPKNCYMLPAEENDSGSGRELVQKLKRRHKQGRGRRTGNRIEHKELAEEVDVTEQQREPGMQSQDPNQNQYIKVIDIDHIGFPQQRDEQDEVRGEQSRTQGQEVAMTVEKQNRVNGKQVEATEQDGEHGQQSQEPSLQEKHSKVIGDQNGYPEEQQDEVNGQKSEKQMQDDPVIAEEQNNAEQKYRETEEQLELAEQHREQGQQSYELNQEQYNKVIDDQNGCSEQQNEQQDDVNGQQSQPQMQEVEMTVEKQKKLKPKCEVTGELVELTEEQRLHEQQSQESSQQEYHRKEIDDQSGCPYEQHDEVNGQQSKNQMHEVAVIVEEQIIAENKYEVIEAEHVEVAEQQREHGQQSQERILEEQLNIVTDSQIGFPNEQKDQVKGQQSQTETQEIAVNVEKQSIAEDNYKVIEEQVEVTEQQKEHGQQSQKLSHVEQQNESLEQQKEQPDEANGQQSRKPVQEIAVIFEKQISAEHNCKPTEEKIQARKDELFEKGFQTKDQQCDVTEEQIQIEDFESRLRLLEEEVEGVEKLIKPGQQNELISERNTLQEHIELTSKNFDSRLASLQKLLLNKQDKAAAIVTSCLLQVSQQLDPQLLFQEKSRELKQNMQPFGQEKQEKAVPFGVGKMPDGQVATDEEQQAENGIKARAVDTDFTESEQSCQKQQGKQEWHQQRQLHPRHKTPSESDCEVLEAPKFQLEQELQQKNPIKVRHTELNHTRSQQSSQRQLETETLDRPCQTQHQMLGQQQQRKLRNRGRNSACGNQKDEEEQQAEKATEQSCQAQHQTPAQPQIRRLGPQGQRTSSSELQVENAPACQEPAQQRQLHPRGQRQSKCEVLITTSMVESPPKTHNLLPNLQGSEKPRELKISAVKTSQTQQQRQLRPRGKEQPESRQATTGSRAVLSPSQSLETMPTVVDNLSQPIEQEVNHQGQRKKLKLTPPTKVSDTLVLTSQQLVAEPQIAVTPAQLKTTEQVELSEPLKELLQQRKLRSHSKGVSQSEPAVSRTESSPSQLQCDQLQEKKHDDELQHRKQTEVVELSQTLKELQRQRHMKLRSQSQGVPQSEHEVSRTESLPSQLQCDQPQEKKHDDELQQTEVIELSQTLKEMQRLRHMKLRSHSQGVSQSEPVVSMMEASTSQHQCNQPQEKKQDDELQHQQPQKRGRGRSPKAKIATAATSDVPLPDKCQKQLEQPDKAKTRKAPQVGCKSYYARYQIDLKEPITEKKKVERRPRRLD